MKEEDEDEDENEPPLLVTRAIGGIFEQIVVKIWKEEKENYEGFINIRIGRDEWVISLVWGKWICYDFCFLVEGSVR